MKDNNSQRLTTLCRSLNLSSSEVLKRLAEYGFTFDNNPNVKIPKECVDLLSKDDKAFSENDKNQKTIDIEAIAKDADIEEKQHNKRLSLICKELNISFSFIQQGLMDFDIEVSNLNQRVDSKTEKLIVEIVSGNAQANLSQLNSEKNRNKICPLNF